MQQTYVDLMSEVWTGSIGQYSVTTRLEVGPGTLTAYIGNPGAGGRAELGGGNMWLTPIPSGAGTQSLRGLAITAGHEVGHVFGEPHTMDYARGDIMNPG